MSKNSAGIATQDEASVTVKKIARDGGGIILTDIDGMDWSFELEADAKVSINGHEGTLRDLRQGEEVTVVFAFRDGGEPLAREIRCTRKG